ncbi:MAG: C-GCAxxG-C-C family protein [Rikenellaceae bacterium]
MTVNIEERVSAARNFFDQGYNCAQAVVLAYSDIMGVESQTLATLSAPFGGGMGRMREVCGAVSGMVMIAGVVAPAFDPSQNGAKSENYKLVQKLADEFRTQNRSIICRELLGLSPIKGVDTAAEQPKKRPCAELVAMAAEIVACEINRRDK